MNGSLSGYRQPLLAGVVGGLVHAVAVGGLNAYLSGPEVFGYSPAANSFGLFEPIHAFILVGTFLLGAVPAVLLVERRLVTPSLTIVAIAAVVALSLPGTLEPHPELAGPSNFDFYFLFWVGPLFVACVAGGVEHLARRPFRNDPIGNGRNTTGGRSGE
jgi:hypothetical protein